MQRVDVTRHNVPQDVIAARPSVDHAPKIIGGDVALYENGTPLLVLSKTAIPVSFRQACVSIKATRKARTEGLITTSQAFGTLTRNALRAADFCTTSALSVSHPKEHSALVSMGASLAETYRAHAPAIYEDHRVKAEGIPRDFRLRDTPFTSGNLNKHASLAYHLDKGNALNVWSAMVVLRERVSGGHLVLPEFGVSLELVDGACLLFDGQSTWHGLTPVTIHPGGYRFSVVYFSLRQAWSCLPFKDELARAKARYTEKARALVGTSVSEGARKIIEARRRKR